MEDPGDPMKTASTTVLTVEKPENGPSGWRQRKPIPQYAGKFKLQTAAYYNAYTGFPQQIAAPRHLKCSERDENLLRRRKRRQNDGKSRRISSSLPTEKIDPSPSGNSTPPPLHPHVKPVMTASSRVPLRNERGTAVDRWRGIKIELPHSDSALPSLLTLIATQTSVRCCYHNIYSRFRLAHDNGCHSAQ